MTSTLPLKPITTCMEKYILYETAAFYYLVGCDAVETYFRVLKLNRSILKPKTLDEILTEDPLVYNKDELGFMLEMIHEGNKTTGGLTRTAVAYGLVGFVKFLDCYYFTLITQKKKVGCVGSNFIYSIKAAEVFAVRPREDTSGELSIMKIWKTVNRKLNKTNTDQAESRYMGLFQFIDISKDFFFSYTYDLTHSLQHNFLMSSSNAFPPPPFREMYEWNKYQTDEIRSCLGDVAASLWTLPIIHGSFQQRKFSLFGRVIDLVLIARRSRHYAGTRYLKRGVSVHGKVANDCEMEQILQLDIGSQKTFASYVQMRGSIPTYWYQETSVTNPKPPILVDRIDPNYLATQEHFSDLIRRYSLPIIVLDLVKHNERRKRECIVGRDFRQAIDVINLNIPADQQIRYIALDFSRMSKNKGHAGGKDVKGAATGKEWSRIESSLGKEVEQNMRRAETGNEKDLKKSGASAGNDDENSDTEESQTSSKKDVLRELEEISSWSLHETGIFSSTVHHIDRLDILQKSQLEQGVAKGYLEQKGVLRTNCIDCLDRTNVAQFAMGVRFLALGLCSLGILDSHSLDPSNAMLLGLMDMYSEMGDRIALQYGGSEAHKKVSKGAGKTKHGEFLTSIKRYYSNSFTDRVKQDAMNLFLGYFQPSQHDFNLWDIETDYFLHNRSLHPPRPDVDRVLFSFSSSSSTKLVHSLSHSQSQSPSQQLLVTDGRVHQKATPNSPINASHTATANNSLQSEGVSSSYPNLTEKEWNEILAKYCIRSSTITPEILQKILKKEQMKKRLRLKQEEVLEAEELWWKQALFDFDTSTSWMCLPPLKENRILSYYETIHCPDRLTSFDYELSQEFQYPYDATVFASSLLKNETNSNIWNRKKKKRNLNHPPLNEDDERGGGGAEGEGAGEGNEDEETGGGDDIQRDQVQFDLFSLARSFGSKAKNFVGDLLSSGDVANPHSTKEPMKAESSDDNLVHVDYSSPYYTRKLNTPYYARKFSDSPVKATYSTKPLTNYDQIALRKYSRYCEDGVHPEVYITENYSASKRDFLVALETVSVDVNDVKEMERLSMESYLHNTVVSGTYKGMQKSDSAKMVTTLVQSSLVFIEPALETCVLIGEDSKEEDIFCAIDPKSTSAANSASISLLSSKSVKSIGTVDLPTSAKIQIENILQGSGTESCVSLEEDILNCANKYLYDQLIYSREIDDDRLSTRLSSLTSELDVLNYMSLYANDLIALDMDSISFMLTDRSSTKPLHHLYNELLSVQTLHQTMNQFKSDAIKSFYENSINVSDTDSPASALAASSPAAADPALASSLTAATAATVGKELMDESDLSWNENLDPLSYVTSRGVGHLPASYSPHGEYPGFLQTGPNVYAKITNPHFVCNEKTVSSYVSYKHLE